MVSAVGPGRRGAGARGRPRKPEAAGPRGGNGKSRAPGPRGTGAPDARGRRRGAAAEARGIWVPDPPDRPRGGGAAGPRGRRRGGGGAAAPGEMEARIEAMGYVTCRPRLLGANYYGMGDGTGAVLRVAIVPTHVVGIPGLDGEYAINYRIHTGTFVREEDRRPAGPRGPARGGGGPRGAGDWARRARGRPRAPADGGRKPWGAEDWVRYEALSEALSAYDLSDGRTMWLAVDVERIDRSAGATVIGEPLYRVSAAPVADFVPGGG